MRLTRRSKSKIYNYDYCCYYCYYYYYCYFCTNAGCQGQFVLQVQRRRRLRVVACRECKTRDGTDRQKGLITLLVHAAIHTAQRACCFVAIDSSHAWLSPRRHRVSEERSPKKRHSSFTVSTRMILHSNGHR